MACASPSGHHGWIPACRACRVVRARATGTGAGALPAPVEYVASICSNISLEDASVTGLFWTLLGGRAISGWCIAVANTSHLRLLAGGCDYCCSPCCMPILEAQTYDSCSNKNKKRALC